MIGREFGRRGTPKWSSGGKFQVDEMDKDIKPQFCMTKLLPHTKLACFRSTAAAVWALSKGMRLGASLSQTESSWSMSIRRDKRIFHSMSDSDAENPRYFWPNSRRPTFDIGTGDVPESAPLKAKRRIRQIIFDSMLIMPKSTYVYQELASSDEIRILRILKGTR